MTEAVFAIPGDKDRRTGGFIYEATVLRTLNEMGCATAHLQLPDSFPSPTASDMADTLALLRDVPSDTPIILDGLVFGAIDPGGLAQVRAPVIAMIHHPLGLETGLSPARAAFLKANEAAALQHAQHVMVPSAETARNLAADFGASPSRITVAPPGFDRPRVDRRTLDPPLILSVGLLAPRKGHDVLLTALRRLTHLPWQAQIVGKPHDRDYASALKAQIAALNLQARVSLVGEIEAHALARAFSAASVFALATRYEGYGMVLAEAMLYGLPIVTCRTGAVPQTVGDAALLASPDNAHAFATALENVLTSAKVADDLSLKARARAAQLPRWQATAQRFIDVIRGGCV